MVGSPQDGAQSRVAALSIRALSKVFGGTRALDGVSFDVLPGTVHGLVGENGSGKSTLIKTLSGYHTPEPGSEIDVAGEPVPLPISAQSLERLRLRFVHQDLTLAANLTVAENLFVDELRTGANWLLRSSVLRRRARDLLAPYGRGLDPGAKVGSLSAADQAHLAIVRAVSGLHPEGEAADQHGVLVLDEVTAFLSSAGRAQLFDLMRDVAARGDSVLFVSHYLDEVLEITSRITVLRDGHLVDTVDTAALDDDDLVELIIGRHMGTGLMDSHTGAVGTDAAPQVSVTGLTGSIVADLSFSIRAGEVLGVAGLIGSGFDEVPTLLFGAQRATGGMLSVDGRDIDLTTVTPEAATARRIAFVPEDRHAEGGVGALTVEENLTLQVIGRYQRGGMLRRRRMHADAKALLEDYDVRPRDPRAKMSSLSGGNQQKVIMAKWLTADPLLLLLHEPTHGVDVGSREQILLRVRAAAQGGMAVLCASSDPEQLAELCDRVLVLARGRVVAELSGSRLTKDAIVESSYLTTGDRTAAPRPVAPAGADGPAPLPPDRPADHEVSENPDTMSQQP